MRRKISVPFHCLGNVNLRKPFTPSAIEAVLRTRIATQADKILEAAARLFASHRFHEAKMEDIAALAEVGKGTIYRYFQDKEALYLALLERATVGLLDRLKDAVASDPAPRGRLVALTQAVLDFFDEQPHLFDLIQHAEAMRHPDREFPWQRVRAATIALVTDILNAGNRTGQWHVGDPGLATVMLLGGLRAVLRFWVYPRSIDAAERIVEGFVGGFARCADNEQLPKVHK
ncbi:MAG: TetR/AcrR family transcriptional regulator [Planctomycetia bacterium]|nr:TetR/AcrR family transcriptional regulator [Planctomycetia bacterium]